MVPEARKFTLFVWFVLLLLIVSVVVVAIEGHRSQSLTATYVQENAFNTNSLSFWQNYGQVYIQYCKNDYRKRKDWLGLIIQCLVLALITLGLHCAELIAHIHRDEAVWRKATTVGVNPTGGILSQGRVMWPLWVIFTFKSVVHWVFGSAFSANCYFTANFIPLTTLTFLFFLLALFIEVLLRYEPKGPQPATYGNLKALIHLVDDWEHRRIFWGDKGEETDGIRRAGTSGQRLADLIMNRWYIGLRLPPGFGVKL
jgi:hypothetical protein